MPRLQNAVICCIQVWSVRLLHKRQAISKEHCCNHLMALFTHIHIALQRKLSLGKLVEKDMDHLLAAVTELTPSGLSTCSIFFCLTTQTSNNNNNNNTTRGFSIGHDGRGAIRTDCSSCCSALLSVGTGSTTPSLPSIRSAVRSSS